MAVSLDLKVEEKKQGVSTSWRPLSINQTNPNYVGSMAIADGLKRLMVF